MVRRRERNATPSEPGFSELTGLMSEVNEKYGNQTMRVGSQLGGYNHIETGIFTLDLALVGGFADGFPHMLFGYESSGKTTTAMRIAAAAQRKHPNKAVVFIDAEGTYDTNWSEHHGVNNDHLFYVQPSTGEEAVNIAHGVLHSEETSLLVLDSLPALAPQEEVDAAVEDKFYALRSQLIARFCQKVIRAKNLHRANGRIPPTVVMINQWRTKIGFVMGDPRKLPGGDQPKYLCHSMVEVKNKEQVGKGETGIDIATHNDHSFNIKKSKAANSLREGSFKMIRDPDHWLGAGAIDDADTVITFAKKFGMWTGAGQSQYLASMGDHKFTSMRVGAEYLQENPDELLRAKQMLIMRQRMASNLTPVPADGYLMGAVDDDIVTLVQEAARQ